MNSGAAAMKGRNARLFASHRGWSSGIRPSLWIMVLSSLVARMEGGSTVGLRPNRWSAAPAGDAFGLFMGEGQYQAQVAAESAWNHGDVPSDVLSGFGDVSRARTFSPVTDSDSEVAIPLPRPFIVDAWHLNDALGFQEARPRGHCALFTPLSVVSREMVRCVILLPGSSGEARVHRCRDTIQYSLPPHSHTGNRA
jgi:hypothetical protein